LKIELKKIPFNPKDFRAEFNGIVLEGIFYKETPNIAKIEANLHGKVEVDCNRCAESFEKEINEDLKLIITDKIFNGFDENYDVIEINSNIVDFDDIISSEIESIKLDFENICKNCKDSF
jgi:uncharacterized metal-binding protein YceD (DUF177 family)